MEIDNQAAEQLIGELCSIIVKLKQVNIIRDNRSIIGNIGEYQCSRRCNLRLARRTNEPYFDAFTETDEKVQIKSSTTGTFYDIRDYKQYQWLYLVDMNSDDLKVKKIYKICSKKVKRLLTRKPYRGIRHDISLTNKNLKKLELIWPPNAVEIV